MTTLYIIQSLIIQNKFYLGITDRKAERIEEHNRGQTKSTRKHKPWILIYQEKFETKSLAMKREKFLKSLNPFGLYSPPLAAG